MTERKPFFGFHNPTAKADPFKNIQEQNRFFDLSQTLQNSLAKEGQILCEIPWSLASAKECKSLNSPFWVLCSKAIPQTGQCKTETAECRLQTRGEMQSKDKMRTADFTPGFKCGTYNSFRYPQMSRVVVTREVTWFSFCPLRIYKRFRPKFRADSVFIQSGHHINKR